MLAIISFNYGYEGFSSDFTREDQKKVHFLCRKIIIEQMVKGYFDHSCLVRRELNSLVLVMSTDGIEDYREQIRSLGEKSYPWLRIILKCLCPWLSAAGRRAWESSEPFCTRP